MAPTKASDRAIHRDMARGLRDNAGIDLRDDVSAEADFGAAARRLRASVRGAGAGGVEDIARRRPVRTAAARSANGSAVGYQPLVGPVEGERDAQRAFASRAADLLGHIDFDSIDIDLTEDSAADAVSPLQARTPRSSVVLRVGRRLLDR